MTATTRRTDLTHVLDALNVLRLHGHYPVSTGQVGRTIEGLVGHPVTPWQLEALLRSACHRGLAARVGGRWTLTEAGAHTLHALFGGTGKERTHE